MIIKDIQCVQSGDLILEDGGLLPREGLIGKGIFCHCWVFPFFHRKVHRFIEKNQATN